MEKQKLIYVESKAQFSPSEVSDKAIVFIKDTKEIWTHGVYFSCSGTWASPITLSLTGDTTGSVSIDGSGNASIATTTAYLSGTTGINDANNAANTQSQKIAYYPRIGSSASNLFAVGNNANAILSLNVHDYSYTHQLGFSSNGNIYHRRRSGGTWETSWKTILSSSNYTNFHHTFASLTNKPTTLSGYGITDCIPIINGGEITTDTDLSTLGMTTWGAKLSVGHTNTGQPSWLWTYSNFLMFRSTIDTYSGISTDLSNGLVTFVGGRIAETTTNNAPRWWFRIKGASEATYNLNSIQNSINNLDSNYLKKSGGTMTGSITLSTESAYINDTASGWSILGAVSASNTGTGVNGLATIFSGAPSLNMVLRTSGDNLYHYNHAKSARYLILDTNNYSTYALPLSGGTMKGALNFANNTWNKVGDDAYMGDCDVSGMIGIKGSNAATPGFAMYNNSGTLLGKLYASGTSLYWSDAKILTASGTSKQFVMGDGSLYSDTVSYTTWTKTTTSGIAWFPIADITDLDQGTALFMVRAYAHSSIIFTVVRGQTNGNINVLAGGGNFNNSYAYIKGVRQVGNVVEIGLNAAATYVKVAIRVLQPTFTYSLRSSLVESTSTTTPYVQYDINSGDNHNFGIISSKFTGNLIGNADTASKWKDARTITLTGDVTGSVTLDGSSNVTLTTAGTGTTSFLKCLDKRNLYPAQIVTSGGKVGAAFMSASKLGLSDGDYYDALILRGYADHTGGNENALLFGKSTSSVYHSQYAFGSTTTWGTMYKFLDSGNYTNYTIGYAKSNLTSAGSVGVIKDGKLYYNSALSFARFVQHDNSGRYSYELIAELTNYGTGTNTSYITYGISGFMWAYREGNGANSCSYSITAIVNVGPAIQQNMLRVSATTNVLIPFVVKYNDKYYIALRKNSSSTVFYFMGFKHNLLTTTIIVDDASLIEEVQGPIAETSTAKYYYNSGSPQQYLHAGNYSSYALPLTGGKLTGKLTMYASNMISLPTIYRDHTSYISGIRLENGSGYLGTVGMNTVNGSLYIMGTDETLYPVLDSRNYNNYSPTLTGTGASGTWAINISGVAASASKVANALTIQLNGGTTAGTNKFVYDGSSAYTINITPEAIGASATNHTHSYLPLSGGTLGNTSATETELRLKSSTATLRLVAYLNTFNYIQSGNADFNGSTPLQITGYNGTVGSDLYLKFTNIYCRAGNYTNIDSGNYSSYALPLSGGTLTDTLISRDIRPSANLSYSLGTSSYYYNYVYANYFKKNGSSDSYVLLGGGGHKAVSDFAPNNVATLSSSGMGNSDQWTLVFEKSYPSYWYNPTTMFYIRSGTIGCGILCFYNYWASGTKLDDYEKEVWFFGAGKSETGITFGGPNRDINDYFRIYIDKANCKYCMYYNRYNNQSLQIQELQFFTVPEPGEYLSTGSLRSSFFTNSNTVVDLPTESSTLIRVPIKTTYNHDRTIRTTKSVYASSFYENSDIRLKENVRGIDQSDLTKQVDLVQFNFKDSGTKKYGVIAQQLEQVGLQNLVYENNGNKAVDYISLLVLEIQRLRNEIGELKQEINKKS